MDPNTSNANTTPSSPITAINPDVTFALHTMEDDLAAAKTPTNPPAKKSAATVPANNTTPSGTPELKPAPSIQGQPTPSPITITEKKSGDSMLKSGIEKMFGSSHSSQASQAKFVPENPDMGKSAVPFRPTMRPESDSSSTKTEKKLGLEEIFGEKSPQEEKSALPPIKPLAAPPVQPQRVTPNPLASFEKSSLSSQIPLSSPSTTLPFWVIKAGIGVFVTLLVGGGAWYFYKTPIIPPDPEEEVAVGQSPTPESNQTPEQTQTPPDKPVLPFDPQKINDLVVSLSGLPSSFDATIADYAQKIKTQNIEHVVEFRIVDDKQMAVSFEQWSKWKNISLPTNILSTLDAPFSILLYNDRGYVRMGLKITSKNPTQTQTLFGTNESNLIKTFLPLYFNFQPKLPLTTPFQSGNYNGTATRYFNFPIPDAPFENGLSLDYTVYNQYLIVGTSKQSVRAIIDTVKPIE